MAKKFGLDNYMDALGKVLKVVKRDAANINDVEDSEFEMRTQIRNLLEVYNELDPDIAFEMCKNLEKNPKILLEEVAFVLKKYFVQSRNLHHHPQRRSFGDVIRFEQLMNKYQLRKNEIDHVVTWSISPIRLAFPEEEYNIKKENPSLCRGLPDEMKRYKNFKREFDVEGIFALLPSGRKYGGFVKAFMNVQLLHYYNDNPELIFLGISIFQKFLAKFRSIYNSKIFSNEKRLEWFGKLEIKESDCALWSRLFDQQYPGYKNVHKFFEQTA